MLGALRGVWSRRGVGLVAGLTACAVGLTGVEAQAAEPGPGEAPAAAAAAKKTVYPGTAPDGVSASVGARLSGHRVEDVSARTESSSTWALPDGSWTSEFASGPVWVRTGDGSSESDWAVRDTTLEAGKDGWLRPVAVAGDVVVSGGAKPDQAGEVVVAAMTDPATGVRSQVRWDGGLPKPDVAGNRAVYPKVRPGVDMVVDVTGTGVEQFFVVDDKPADPGKLDLATRVVAVGQEAGAAKVRGVEGRDGSASLVTGGGDVVAQVAGPTAWDARADASLANPVAEGVGGADMTGPVVWGERLEAAAPKTGGSPGAPGVEVAVDTDVKAAGAGVDLGLDASDILVDPKTKFPVVVDPAISLSNTFDTWVQTGTSTDQSGSSELRLGTYDGGKHVARSFINFNVAPTVGKDVVSSSLSLLEFHSYSCTARAWDVYATGVASSGTRWTAQPKWATKWATSTQTKGYSSACPAGRVTANTTNLAKTWARSKGGVQAVGLRAASETDNLGWKRFYSGNSSYVPTLSVSYNRAPGALGKYTYAGASQYHYHGSQLFVRTKKPGYKAVVTDPDGGTLRAVFGVKQGAKTIWTAPGTQVASGGTSVLGASTVALAEGGVYAPFARASDGRLSGPMTTGTTFTVDTTPPAAPTITSSAYASSGTWLDQPPAANTFTLATTSTDAVSFTYTVDGDAPVTVPAQDLAATIEANPGTGGHVVSVVANDKAGWASKPATFAFGSGDAGMTAPTDGAKSTDQFQVIAAGVPATSGTVTPSIYWRAAGDKSAPGAQGSTEGWTKAKTLPAIGAGKPVTVDTSWSGAAAAKELKTERTPVLLDVQVCFAYSGGATKCTWTDQAASHVSVVRVPHAFGDNYPTADAGPGQVALWTGEFNTSVTDVSVPGYVGDLTVSRSYSSQAGANGHSVFGPGWTASFDGTDTGVAGWQVVDNTDGDGTIALVDAEGEALVYRQPGDGRVAAKAGVYTPADLDTAQAGARLVLTGSGTNAKLTFTEDDGTITRFAHTGTKERLWVPESVTEPGTAGATSFTRDGAGRVTRILAPVPPGVTCPAQGGLNPGCRAITITYADKTTAEGSSNGDVAGQVKTVSYTGFDPDKTGGPGMVTVPVAAYAYDSHKRLVKVADPRTNLAVTYAYDGTSTTGQPLLTAVTPSGLAGYELAYGKAARDEKSLLTVDRGPAVTGGDSTRLARYVYGITPADHVAGLPVVNTGLVEAWKQPDTPVYGAAVFASDRPGVSGSDPGDPSESDWAYADLQYTDAEGRVVNTAAYGAGDWQFTATAYDTSGNQIRSLDQKATALLRKEAADHPVSQAEADSYATITRYNPAITAPAAITWGTGNDGIAGATIAKGEVLVPAGSRVVDVWEPATTAGADGVPVRAHTHTDYDQGAPAPLNPKTGQPFGLATTVTTSQASAEAATTDPGATLPTGEPVVSQTLTGYTPIDKKPATDPTSGWILGQATTTTQVMGDGQANIVTSTRYDAEGNVVESRSPASTGKDAATHLNGYYTTAPQSGVFAPCGNHPEWAGLACASRTAETTPTVPVTTTSKYSLYLASRVSSETLAGATRTVTTSYDQAGRLLSTATTTTGLAGSSPVPATKNVYDPETGLQTATVSLDAGGKETGRITSAYDAWGRATRYTDTDGAITTTTYDTAGRVGSVTDRFHTTTYTYDTATEHRGLTTKVAIDGVGDYTAVYDATGAMTTQGLPGGITEHLTHDRSGEVTGLSYTGKNTDGEDVDLLAWSITTDVQGKTTTQTSSAPGAGGLDRVQSFAYDRADRLTHVTDNLGHACTTRAYGFDPRGNRTSLATTTKTSDQTSDGTGGEEGGACDTTTGTSTKTWTHDSADRTHHGANNTGTYTYDPLGRQTTIPATDAPGASASNTSGNAGDLTIAYYDTDAAKTITQAGATTTYTLDPAGRRSVETTTTGADNPTTTRVQRHYTDTSDNPGYVTETDTDGATSNTWYGGSINGDLGITVTGDTKTLSLIDPLGSIATTLTLDIDQHDNPTLTLGPVGTYDEYGNPLTQGTPNNEEPAETTTTTATATAGGPIGYGWLGGKQRPTHASGLLLMGARLYNPTTGLFTTTDPIPGGNTTTYTYPQDPINQTDLDGSAKKEKPRKCGWKCKAAAWAASKAVGAGCALALAATAIGAGIARYACSALGGGVGELTKYFWKYHGRGFKTKDALKAFAKGSIQGLFGTKAGKYVGKYLTRWARGTKYASIVRRINRMLLHGARHA